MSEEAQTTGRSRASSCGSTRRSSACSGRCSRSRTMQEGAQQLQELAVRIAERLGRPGAGAGAGRRQGPRPEFEGRPPKARRPVRLLLSLCALDAPAGLPGAGAAIVVSPEGRRGVRRRGAGTDPDGLVRAHLGAAGRSRERRTYRVGGFRPCGDRVVRVDIVERLADMIRAASTLRIVGGSDSGPSAFQVTSQMTSLTGCSGEGFASILKALGFESLTVRRSEIVWPAAAVARRRAGGDAAADSPARKPDAAARRGGRRRTTSEPRRGRSAAGGRGGASLACGGQPSRRRRRGPPDEARPPPRVRHGGALGRQRACAAETDFHRDGETAPPTKPGALRSPPDDGGARQRVRCGAEPTPTSSADESSRGSTPQTADGVLGSKAAAEAPSPTTRRRFAFARPARRSHPQAGSSAAPASSGSREHACSAAGRTRRGRTASPSARDPRSARQRAAATAGGRSDPGQAQNAGGATKLGKRKAWDSDEGAERAPDDKREGRAGSGDRPPAERENPRRSDVAVCEADGVALDPGIGEQETEAETARTAVRVRLDQPLPNRRTD